MEKQTKTTKIIIDPIFNDSSLSDELISLVKELVNDRSMGEWLRLTIDTDPETEVAIVFGTEASIHLAQSRIQLRVMGSQIVEMENRLMEGRNHLMKMESQLTETKIQMAEIESQLAEMRKTIQHNAS